MTEIYDKNRMKVRTNLQQVNTLFEMGKELEQRVDEYMPGKKYVEIIDNITYYTIVVGESI